MAEPPSRSTPSLAVFMDYENVALGAEEAGYGNFDVGLVLKRILDKGNVIVKRTYADWTRFKSFRQQLHEAAFELIEVPHVSYSGKNSADIRMVVDALDLCHTNPHVDTFVLVTGDSDFSPLVSTLRANGKAVVGVGVKKSTSNLLVENCDDFIYYDDLVREQRKMRRAPRKRAKRSDGTEGGEDRRDEAMDLLVETVSALMRERGEPVWSSHVKQVIKRKQPHFAESFYGYQSFNDLLEDAGRRGLLKLRRDDRSGGYEVLGLGEAATA
jgi:uncharacterized protein (TIGR00288 family)